MKITLFRTALIYLVISLISFTSSAVENIDNKLAELDKLRLKDRNAFSQQLALLNQDKALAQFTSQQQNKLALLKAWDLAVSSNFNSALEIITPLENADDINISLNATSLKVNIYSLSSQYTEAFIGIEKLLSSIATTNDEELYYQTIVQVILLYNKIERYDAVPALVNHGLKITQSSTLLCRLKTLALPNMYHTLNYNEYEAEYNQVIAQCNSAQEFVFNLITIRNHMFYLLEQNQSAAVLILYKQHIDEIIQLNYPLLTAGFHAAAAEALLNQGELVKASEFAAIAEKNMPTNQHDPAVLATYRVQYILAKAQKNFQNLLYYGDKRRDTEQAIAREKTSQQLAYQFANNETHLREQRIKLLDKDNELLTLERNLYQQQAQNQFLWLILLCGIMLALAAFAYRSFTHSRRFRRMAEFDQLTGISNRHHFYQQANLAIKYCQQNNQPIAAILFDLDFFKNVNDNYGHAAGDWVLQQIVRCCSNFMRNNDIFGRLGGEEFAIILPNCTQEKAEMMAEICRDAIANINADHIAKQFSLTASFGVSDATQAGYDLSELLANADKALYKAKAHGRNQVWCLA